MPSKREIKRRRKKAMNQKCLIHPHNKWIGINPDTGEFWCIYCQLDRIG